MLKDDTTKAHNGDVIDRLKDKISIINTAYSKGRVKKSKIIWNVDKNCSKTCVFCAYGNQDEIAEQISLDDKKELVDSLNTLRIDHLDFATGDNPNIAELKEIIRYSKSRLNAGISLTATSEVLEALGVSFIKKNLSYVEITYDYPRTKDNKYREEHFNRNNYKIAKELINEGVKVEALVILYKNLKYSELRIVKNDLSKMGVKKILLIRLMPVGKQSIDDYPKELLQKNTYQNTIGLERITNSKPNIVSIHCSLKGLKSNIKEPCEMGNNKLGISSSGDVYACPWAEHLNIENNPFLIGNILSESDSLHSLLLESSNYKRIIDEGHENQPHCKIFSYLNTKDIFANSDRLYN